MGFNNILGVIGPSYVIESRFIADRSLLPLPRGGWLNIMTGWGATQKDNKARQLFSVYAIDGEPLALDLVKPDGSRVKFLGNKDLLPGAPVYSYGQPATVHVERLDDGTLTVYQDGIAVRRGNLGEVTQDCQDGTIDAHVAIYEGGSTTSWDANEGSYMLIKTFKIQSLPK